MPLKLSQMMNNPAMSADIAPQPVQMRPESVGAVIGKYNTFGKRLAGNVSLREIATELMQIAEMAESTIMEAGNTDWFDGHTVQRNIKEMKAYVKEIAKISEEYDSLHMRARALVDDCGRVLERYFDIHDEPAAPAGENRPELQMQYDTDDDQEADLAADNTPSKTVPAGASKMFHEDETSQTSPSQRNCGLCGNIRSADMFKDGEKYCTSCVNSSRPKDVGYKPTTEDAQARAKDLTERIVSLARHRLTGEQLNRFDTLKKEIQIRAAWKIIR